MTIQYTINNESYTAEPNQDGMYNATECMRNGGRIKTMKDFTCCNNKQWEGQYISTKGRYGGTLGTEQFTVALLQYLGATSITVDGIEMRVSKAERAEVEFGSKLMEAMGKVYEVIPQFSVLGGKYRIDFYIPETRQAFEYDEGQHFTEEGRIADAIRQKEIEEVLGCVFIRIPH